MLIANQFAETAHLVTRVSSLLLARSPDDPMPAQRCAGLISGVDIGKQRGGMVQGKLKTTSTSSERGANRAGSASEITAGDGKDGGSASAMAVANAAAIANAAALATVGDTSLAGLAGRMRSQSSPHDRRSASKGIMARSRSSKDGGSGGSGGSSSRSELRTAPVPVTRSGSGRPLESITSGVAATQVGPLKYPETSISHPQRNRPRVAEVLFIEQSVCDCAHNWERLCMLSLWHIPIKGCSAPTQDHCRPCIAATSGLLEHHWLL